MIPVPTSPVANDITAVPFGPVIIIFQRGILMVFIIILGYFVKCMHNIYKVETDCYRNNFKKSHVQWHLLLYEVLQMVTVVFTNFKLN